MCHLQGGGIVAVQSELAERLLREKDRTIAELSNAVDAARRRAAVLESALEEAAGRGGGAAAPASKCPSGASGYGGTGAGGSGSPRKQPGGGRGGAGRAPLPSSVRELALKSKLTQENYRRIKDDYQRCVEHGKISLRILLPYVQSHALASHEFHPTIPTHI